MNSKNNKYKNINNVFYTNDLFYETTIDKTNVIYTLKETDHEGYPSLYRLYMEEEDPLEYTFANKYLDGWLHWTRICESTWFIPYIQRWRQELDLKLKSRALIVIKQEAGDPHSRNRWAAAKYLMERGWEPKKTQTEKKEERASKESIRTEAKRLQEEQKRVQADLDRLNIGAP